jgi:hypothetical protein
MKEPAAEPSGIVSILILSTKRTLRSYACNTSNVMSLVKSAPVSVPMLGVVAPS